MTTDPTTEPTTEPILANTGANVFALAGLAVTMMIAAAALIWRGKKT